MLCLVFERLPISTLSHIDFSEYFLFRNSPQCFQLYKVTIIFIIFSIQKYHQDSFMDFTLLMVKVIINIARARKNIVTLLKMTRK